ncbi:MAG: FAD-dependent oxidoreductase [Micrococcales bacterium]|nr:FAD-dependent oxidoreductase [Micrococcales bacterium]OJX66674.1 MAG: hypothetical protein BGO94_07450 [Micrococcales bacterium 72-143]
MSADPSVLPAPEELRAALQGALHLPGEAGFDRAALPWNVSVTARPLAVVEAADPDDVQAAVAHAARHGIRITVLGPGHGASARLAGTLLVRTGALRRLEVSADARTAIVGAGVSWGELQSALDGTGLTGLVGSSPVVSVVGLVLQGGYSWLSRAFGSTAGSLRAAEVVTADGARGWVDESTDAELLWGLRGGGGRYVAVTAVELDLVPSGELAGGRLMLPVEAAPAVLAAWAAATRSCDPATSLWASILNFPPLPELPEPLRGRSFVAVDAVTTAGVDALERVLAPIRAAGPVVHDTVGARAPGRLGDICEEPTAPAPAVQRGIPLTELPDTVLPVLLGAATAPGRFLQVQLRHLAGAPTRREGFATEIEAEYVVNALAIAPVPEAVAAAEQSMEALAETLAPWTGGTLLPSFVATWRDLGDSARPDRIERLASVARRLDPQGVFTASLDA